MNRYKSVRDRVFREYTLLSAEEITQRDFFEVLCLFAGIEEPNQLFNQYRRYDELLGEDIELLKCRNDNGYALAAFVKLIRDSVSMIMSKNMSDFTVNMPSSSHIEKDLSISAHARRVSQFLASVSKENIHMLCIRLAQKIYDPMRETVWFTCLDSKNRIIGEHCLGKGGFGNSLVNIRKLIAISLKSDAAALIVSHNHPNGNPTPSQSDLEVTEHLDRLCSYLNIHLIDHIIVVPEKYISIKKPHLHSSNEKYDVLKNSKIKPESFSDGFTEITVENSETCDNTKNKINEEAFFESDGSIQGAFEFDDTYDLFSYSVPNDDRNISESGDIMWIPRDCDELEYSDEGESDCGGISAAEAFEQLMKENTQ